MFFYLVVDSTKCVTLNILRSTGRPQITVYGNLVSCLVIMLPLGWCLSVDMSYGNTHITLLYYTAIVSLNICFLCRFVFSFATYFSLYLCTAYSSLLKWSHELLYLTFNLPDCYYRTARSLVCDVHCLANINSSLPSSCAEDRLESSDRGESKTSQLSDNNKEKSLSQSSKKFITCRNYFRYT